MHSKETISMQQLEICNSGLPEATARHGETFGSLQILQATSHLSGWVTAWETSQETKAPANDSVGGSDFSESEPSPWPRPMPKLPDPAPCQSSLALSRCSGPGVPPSTMWYWGPLVFTCKEMNVLSVGWSRSVDQKGSWIHSVASLVSKFLESFYGFLHQATFHLKSYFFSLPGSFQVASHCHELVDTQCLVLALILWLHGVMTLSKSPVMDIKCHPSQLHHQSNTMMATPISYPKISTGPGESPSSLAWY